MLTIADGGSLTRALSTSLDPQLKRLLLQRRNQLGGDIEGLARFLILQPGDTLNDLERELGFPIRGDPEDGFGCEWIEHHAGVTELVWILTDDGFAHVVLIELTASLDPQLLKLCTVQA